LRRATDDALGSSLAALASAGASCECTNCRARTSRPRARIGPHSPTLPTSRRDRTIELAQSLCPLIQSVAADNGLPVEFFARLIWQESRLRPDAIGPVTRSGKRAQGIAQFMPATAADRLLLDAFDPAQALPKSAEFLRELRAQFGNLGLAAAAYNAGPQRVQDWLAGKRRLPSETLALCSQRDRPLRRGMEAAPTHGRRSSSSATGWRAPRLPDTISCKRSISRSLEAVNRSSCAGCWEARRSGIASASRRRLAKQRKRRARSCVQPEEPVWPSATDLQSREPRSTLVQDGTCSFEDLPSSCA
jgi:hypothetical protein